MGVEDPPEQESMPLRSQHTAVGREGVRREAARLRELARIGARLNAQLDLSALLNTVCEESAQALDVPVVSVLLYEPSGDVFFHAATYGLPSEACTHLTPLPRALYDEYTQQMGSLVVVPDVQATPGLPNIDLYTEHNLRTAAVVSLVRETERIGLLVICTQGVSRVFSDDELILLHGVADRAALAIINARLFQEVQEGRERLQVLSNRLLEVQEAERRHLARELHDGLTQTVSALAMRANFARRTLESDPGAALLELEKVEDLARETAREIRHMIFILHPREIASWRRCAVSGR